MFQFGQNQKSSWWQSGVIYHIYPRSFLDTDQDGIGDLEGIIQKLAYLNDGSDKSLGIDAIWLNPIFPSPMVDFGYDISDYCAIHSDYGQLATFDRLITEAHSHQIKVILDFVPNHTSDQHPWFLASRSNRMNPQRDWYIWRDAGEGKTPPNNWGSAFGGSAWEWDEPTSQYYLHTYLKEQPDLNWRNPEVREAMGNTLRFWLDRGVDGFRMDVVGVIMKDPGFQDNPLNPVISEQLSPEDLYNRQMHLYDQDLDEVHDVIRSFRLIVDQYPDRLSIGEVWYELPRWVKYYGEHGEELDLPFNFRLMNLPWDAETIRQSVDELENVLPAFAWPNYVLNSHDAPRFASKIGQNQARIAAMLLLTLRGTPFLYYGEELGMENGEIHAEQMRDPQGIRLGIEHSRDFSRTPMQWTAEVNAGFSNFQPWLPITSKYQEQNVSSENADPSSMLNLYRRLIRLRKDHPALHSGTYLAIDAGSADCYIYERLHAGQERFIIALNFSSHPCHLYVSSLNGGNLLLSTHLDRTEQITGSELDLRGNEGVIIEAKSTFAPGRMK